MVSDTVYDAVYISINLIRDALFRHGLVCPKSRSWNDLKLVQCLYLLKLFDIITVEKNTGEAT